ncbi:ATP-dependent DNA helicase [Paenibacillus sp. NPDC056579]|uniref:ATP-dependent DNA helicase n=1 Tax=Paenibacillus sp. NPDC056579 TaxID=3345871 RepID=UPI0036A87634
MPYAVKLSVRALVEYVYRGGSIDSGFRTTASLQEGTKAHQAIQNNYGEHDRKEVHLSGDWEHDDLLIQLEGRCDGIIRESEGELIEEIKSTAGRLELILEDSHPVHWAQAKCYAYLYCVQEELESIRIRLTYVQVDTEQTKQFIQSLTRTELQQFMDEVILLYLPYAKLQARHAEARDRSVKELPFPYAAYRQGQRKLAGAVYKSIMERQTLFAKAPTGTGKTISTLFPSIKAIGEGHLQKLYYLTAKTITRTAAEEAFRLMRSNGLQLRYVTLTAKDKICFKEETRCQKEYCEFADGYYDRINAAVLDLLSNEQEISREVIEAYAMRHKVCPFEFSLDVSYAADAVICDYNYVFDPKVSLKRMMEEQKKQTAILIDEAHNLVDRGRDMFSATLTKYPFLQLKREFKESNALLAKAANAVNDFFIRFRKAYLESGSVVMPSCPEELAELLEPFIAAAEAELSAGNEMPAEAATILLETYFTAQTFIRTLGYYNEAYITLAELDRNDIRLKLFCLDPSGMLRQMAKGFRSRIFFSATLSPLHYYREMLGGSPDDYVLTIPSPFRKEQLDVLLLPLSTRFRDRERTKRGIAVSLHQILQERSGNYLIFFPSYDYLNEVLELFIQYPLDVQLLVQRIGMSEEEKEAFLDAFQPNPAKPCIGFAVMGGMFSEGIDLTGDRLTGTVVVGVGLPQINIERNLIKQYFDRNGRNGFDYAYVYPGINKVLQAGGRLIRTETDHGTLLLVDDRFEQRQYEHLLPEEWKPLTRYSHF